MAAEIGKHSTWRRSSFCFGISKINRDTLKIPMAVLHAHLASLWPVRHRYLTVVSINVEPQKVNWIRTFDWESVRNSTSLLVHPLTGLYLSSQQPGGTDIRSAAWLEILTKEYVVTSVSAVSTGALQCSDLLWNSRLDSSGAANAVEQP